MVINIPEKFGLPRRPFLYTLDQISSVCHIDLKRLQVSYIYFEGRSTGIPTRHLMRACNIAPIIERPDWRVEEKELMRWMRVKGFKGYAS